MEIKITEKVLSLPPYISTSWKNISSLRLENRAFGHVFLIELASGGVVEIPNLDLKILETVFTTHARVIEQEHSPQNTMTQTFTFPFALPIEGITSILQHNPEQSDAPPLPAEMLDKLKSVKEILPQDLSSMPKSEPHCNCPCCQILRAITQEETPEPALIEEPVSEEDLKFKTWDIKLENDKLYCVTNPLDPKEYYHVFLGDPLGCTCGEPKCKHIDAVLRT
jgi:hypothetical protein